MTLSELDESEWSPSDFQNQDDQLEVGTKIFFRKILEIFEFERVNQDAECQMCFKIKIFSTYVQKIYFERMQFFI